MILGTGTVGRTVAVVACCAALLTGCATTTAGSGVTAAPGGGTGPAPSGAVPSGAVPSGAVASTPAPGTTVAAAAFAARMARGVRSVTSARLALQVDLAGQSIEATGYQEASDGDLTAARLQESIPDFGDLTLVLLGKDVFVKLPAKYATDPARPWYRVDATSRNPVVKTFAGTLDSLLSSSSLKNFGLLAAAASRIRVVGPATVDGAAATGYDLTIDVSRIPDDFPNVAALRRSGITEIPMRLWLDGQDRIVRLVEDVSVQGQSVRTEVRLSDFGKRETIEAPKSTEIATD